MKINKPIFNIYTFIGVFWLFFEYDNLIHYLKFYKYQFYREANPTPVLIIFPVINALIFIVSGLLKPEIRERGITISIIGWKWEDIKSYNCEKNSITIKVNNKFLFFRYIATQTFKIKLSQKPEIDELLKKYLPDKSICQIKVAKLHVANFEFW
jgi:hypothetical protein